jgi:ApaG protein
MNKRALENLPKAIDISVDTEFLTKQKKQQGSEYVFSYTITITNNSDQTVQLIARDWLVTDADGKLTTAQGKGVVGQQPTILPGSSYSYTSGSIIDTPVGTMQGHYQMVTDEGVSFTVDIPIFRLAIPNILN